MSETNAEAKKQIKKATDLRSEGRIEEAILSARKATSLAPEDANTWWQLALCQQQKEGFSCAISSLQKTVEFAPYFAEGWCQLGLAYKKTAMLDKAIESYERALKEDSSHIRTLDLLEIALNERDFQKDKNRRIEVLSELNELGKLDADKTFNYAYLLGERKDYLASIKLYEKHTKLSKNPAAGYNNLGYNFEKIGRDLDSIDAYRKAASLDADYDTPRKNIAIRLPALLNLRELAIKKSPYLEKEYWYKYYINPFELLDIDDPYEVAGDPKTLQKYKQALYREIELEEGKVEWMPGLMIDKSTAISTCEQLSDPSQFKYHQAILENKALCSFLTRGGLEHFLVDPNPEEPVTLPHDLDKDLLSWLGVQFREQYNVLLAKAIENGDLEVIECLLDGRRWVLPEHEDRCFEGARRVMGRLMEPLQKLSSSAEEKIKVQLTDVQSALNNGKLNRILLLLPAEFTDTHASVFASLRTISVSIYNSQQDAEVAKAVIELGRFATEKSPVIAQQFDDDQRILSEKIQEEKAKEAHLNFGNKSLAITKAGAAYDGKKISPSDIAAARWGLVITNNSPRTARFSIAFKDNFDNDINVSWSSTQIDEQKKHWGSLVDATMHYLLDALIINFKKRLDEGKQTFVGPLSVTSSGVVFEIDGWFSKKKVFCPWSRLSTDIENGSLIVKDPTERKASVDLSLESVDNAFVLHFLALKK